MVDWKAAPKVYYLVGLMVFSMVECLESDSVVVSAKKMVGM